MSNYGRKNISEVTIVKALEMVKDGYSYSLVAEEIGCNKSLIGKWVKKAGIKSNTQIKKKNKPYNRESHISQDWKKVTTIEQLLSQQRQQDIEKIEKMFEENYPNEEEDDTLDMANIFIDFKNKVLKDVIKKLNDKKNI